MSRFQIVNFFLRKIDKFRFFLEARFGYNLVYFLLISFLIKNVLFSVMPIILNVDVFVDNASLFNKPLTGILVAFIILLIIDFYSYLLVVTFGQLACTFKNYNIFRCFILCFENMNYSPNANLKYFDVKVFLIFLYHMTVLVCMLFKEKNIVSFESFISFTIFFLNSLLTYIIMCANKPNPNEVKKYREERKNKNISNLVPQS